MKKLALKIGVMANTSGQNFIEYALIAGLVVSAAGAVLPDMASGISTSISHVASVMSEASSQGGGISQSQTEVTTSDKSNGN
jgi:Flp pilus assembly pilin Flp